MDEITTSLTPANEIRAYYTNDFIRVYQAFSDEIAESALENKTFVSYRTIQIGLRNQAVEDYCKKWIANISDVTSLVEKIKGCIDAGDIHLAISLLPQELPYKI